MGNSSYIDYTKISPNSTNPRNQKISVITIHHMAGNISVESCGNVFSSSYRKASSNYGIDSNGRVGMYVEEKNRSWASSNSNNDHKAITIEVANDVIGGDWHVSDSAFNKLILLCADICKRNDIKKLIWTGDSNGNLTIHRFFANTSCPGEYLLSLMGEISRKVNLILEDDKETVTETEILVNGEVKRIKRIMKDGKNYVGLREICGLLGVNVSYDETLNLPIVYN